MSGVYRIVIVMSLVVPAAACLLILGSLGAIIIAQWTRWSADCKIWNHSTTMHNWRYRQQSIWNWGLYSSTAEVSGFLVYQLHIKGIVLYYWCSLRCVKCWIVIYYVVLKCPHIAEVLLPLESDGACTSLNGHSARKSAFLVLVWCYKGSGDREQIQHWPRCILYLGQAFWPTDWKHKIQNIMIINTDLNPHWHSG